MSETIKTIDLSTNPFYAGVVAATEARERFDEQASKGASFDDLMVLFWLDMGTHMQRLQLADERAQELFMAGVMTRAPQRPPSVVVQFTTTNAAFHAQDEDAEDFDTWRDDDDRNTEAARILSQVAQEIRVGSEKGTIHDVNGQLVGQYRVG